MAPQTAEAPPKQTPEDAADLKVEEQESEFYLEEPDYGDLLGAMATDSGEGEGPTETPETGEAVADPAPGPDPAPEPEPAPAAEPHFTNEHYGYGHAIGLSPEEVRAFGTPEVFEKMLHRIGGALGQDPARAAVQQQVAADNPDAEQQTYENPGDYNLEEEDVYDESILGMNTNTNQRFTHLESRLAEMEGLNKRLQADVAAREFDSLCDQLPDDIFGRGRLNALGEGHAMNRVRLANEVSRSGHGYQVRNEQLPPLDMLLKRAYHAAFGDQIQDRTLKDLAERTGRQVAQTTALPTNSEAADLDPRQKAIAAATQWHRDNATSFAHDESFIGE
jgi:hypothetical protein